MNVTFLRPVALPSKCRLEAEVVQSGKLVGLAKATMSSVDGKKVYATCEHHKLKDPKVAERLAKAAKL